MSDFKKKFSGVQCADVRLADTSGIAKKMMGDEFPKGFIAGWASTPDVDYYGDIVRSGAFDESIAQRGLRGPEGVKLLIQHDAGKPAGTIDVLETRDGRLWLEGQLNLEISYVRDYYEAAKMNGGMNFSVGFYVEDAEWNEETELFLISKGDLLEVSLVTFPGNRAAHMTEIKSAPQRFDTISSFEKALVADHGVRTRNAANEITRMIKMNAHLFEPSAAKGVQESPDESLSEIRKSIRDLRAAFKPQEA